MIEKLTRVKVGEEWYLCELHEDKNKVELRFACEWEDNVHDGFVSWIKNHNMETLSTVRVGNNSGFIEEPLDVEQTCLLRRLWENMQKVKRTALRRLENDYFGKAQ